MTALTDLSDRRDTIKKSILNKPILSSILYLSHPSRFPHILFRVRCGNLVEHQHSIHLDNLMFFFCNVFFFQSERRQKHEKENEATLADEVDRVKMEVEQEKAELQVKP